MLAFYLSLAESGGEKQKFEKIYLKYRGLMLSRAYEILRDSELVEDCVHDAFLRVLKNMRKLGDVDSKMTKSYVMITLENSAKTMYKKQKREKIVELDENMPDDSQVESDIENKLTAELVAEKIAILPDTYRDIMVLKYLHELNDKEIASALGISEAAARKRLQRARERLKKLIGGNKNG